jgi:hypothetical protein
VLLLFAVARVVISSDVIRALSRIALCSPQQAVFRVGPGCSSNHQAPRVDFIS